MLFLQGLSAGDAGMPAIVIILLMPKCQGGIGQGCALAENQNRDGHITGDKLKTRPLQIGVNASQKFH